MTATVFTRRMFLCAALAAANAAAVGAARAVTLEEDPELQRRYDAACESRAVHDERMRALVGEFEQGAADVTPELHARAMAAAAAMRCPVCGCKLGPIDPYPARF